MRISSYILFPLPFMWKIVKVKNGANIDAKGKNLAEKFIEKMTCFTYRDQLH